MSNFNLKRKMQDKVCHLLKQYFIRNWCNLINNKIQYINKNLNTVLTLDESLNDNIHKKLLIFNIVV